MTNELEKQFFDTFGIERKLKTFAIKRDEQGDLIYPPIYEYPQITDRILLELICMLSKTLTCVVPAYNIDELKQYVLSSCIRYIDKHQIRTLFEEEK